MTPAKLFLKKLKKTINMPFFLSFVNEQLTAPCCNRRIPSFKKLRHFEYQYKKTLNLCAIFLGIPLLISGNLFKINSIVTCPNPGDMRAQILALDQRRDLGGHTKTFEG